MGLKLVKCWYSQRFVILRDKIDFGKFEMARTKLHEKLEVLFSKRYT